MSTKKAGMKIVEKNIGDVMAIHDASVEAITEKMVTVWPECRFTFSFCK